MIGNPDEHNGASDKDGDQISELDGDLAPCSLAISASPMTDRSVVEFIVLLERKGWIYMVVCAIRGARR